jgi:S-adenosylmethionine-diacylglycerol 3-amino-3-carboxypropyl transferase
VSRSLSMMERIEDAAFRFLTARNLIYNTSWEDPAVDRRTMKLGPDDRALVITSGGCNVLDYALDGPAGVIAVDVNPRQTALLELKLAAIRHLSHADAFAIFGRGWHKDFAALYKDKLRQDLSPFARTFWDGHQDWFASAEHGLFTRGLTGVVFKIFRRLLRSRPALGDAVRSMFAQTGLEAQRRIYLEEVRPRFFTPFVRWFLSSHILMAMIGVPLPQRRLVEESDDGERAGSAQRLLDELFCTVPVTDNYFWGVYIFGHYDEDRCPRYLTPHGFAQLKAGLVDRIDVHTSTLTDYLQRPGPVLTHAVLLDHMDWMSSYYPAALEEEWDALLKRMKPGGTVLFRSAHASPPFLDTTRIGPARKTMREALVFRDDEARRLAQADRVHTYAGFCIAEIPAHP